MSAAVVGRDAELAEINKLLRKVRQGRSQVLLLTGEPGIGKSTLALAAVQNLPTYRFYHREQDSNVPLAAVRQIAEQYATHQLDAQLSSLDLATELLGRMEFATEPAAALIENVHLMDQQSKEVIWHVAQRANETGLLIIFTSSEPRDWLTERLVSHLAVGDLGTHLHIGPLTPAAVREFVYEKLQLPLTSQQLARIMTASGGSPFYLDGLLSQLESSRLSTDSLASAIEALSSQGPEEGLLAALRRLLAELGDAHTAALLVIALGGPLTEAQLDRACALLDVDHVDVTALRATGLLASEVALVMRRQGLGDAITRLRPASERQAAHRALGQVLTGLESLRHRVAARSDDDAELMNDLIMALIGAADARDLDTAHLLASWMAEVDPNMLPTACLMTFRARRPDMLLDHEDEIRAMLPGPMRQVLIAGLEVVATGREPVELTDRQLLESGDETVLLLLAHIYSELARLHAATAVFLPPRMLGLVREAIDRHLATAEGPPEKLGELRALSGVLRMWWILGTYGLEPRRAIEELFTLAEELEAAGIEDVALRAIQIAATVTSYLASNAHAVEQLDALLDRVPSASHDLTIAAIRFRLNFLGGQWDAAQLVNEPALAHALDAMGEIDTIRAQALSAIIPLCRGERELGERIIERVQRLESASFNASTGTANWSLGWVGAINGDPEAVVNNFDPMWRQQTSAIFSGVASGLLRVRAYAELGDADAAQLAQESLLALPLDDESRRYFTLHGEAVLASLSGDAELADLKFRAARGALETLIEGTPQGWLLFRSLLAEDHERILSANPSLIRPGDETALDDAIRLALQLGAKPWRNRLEGLRSRWPDRRTVDRNSPVQASPDPVVRDLTSLDHLTSREREITLLMLNGLGNREIAQRLFLSVRTVEFHVRNALQKLNAPSRVELRARLGSLSNR